MTDLGTLGLQGKGAYETSYSALLIANAQIGNSASAAALPAGRQVQPLRPETSTNFDAGIRIAAKPLSLSVTAFRIDLYDAIVSQTLLLPPGQTGVPLGDQIISSQLPNGAIFVPISNSPVLVRGNLGHAKTFGIEQQLLASFSSSLQFASNFTWIHAADAATGLPPDIEGGNPPAKGHLRLRYYNRRHRLWLEPYSSLAYSQSRLSSLALNDRRIGAPRTRNQIATFFRKGATQRGLVANGLLLPSGETLSQVQSRVLGSANSAPLFTAMPGYALLDQRGGLSLGERSDLFLDFSIVADKFHRGISWGADGPGRAISIRFLARW